MKQYKFDYLDGDVFNSETIQAEKASQAKRKIKKFCKENDYELVAIYKVMYIKELESE